jgi:tripartite-type tricarboxylate transporter receptor subunit TctC
VTRPQIAVALACALALLGTPPAAGQSYPQGRPIELIVPYSPGGVIDTIGRPLAKALSDALGHSVVVVNRDGAAGAIGMRAVAEAAPDGHTLGLGPAANITMLSHPRLKRDVNYTVDSFDYVCQTLENHFVLVVREDSAFRDVRQLVDFARANPGKLNFGLTGRGNVPHAAISELMHVSGTQMVLVSYKGDAPTMNDLLGKTLDFAVLAIGSVGSQPVRVIGIFAAQRNERFPDVPTMVELGYPVVYSALGGIYAPRGLPAPVLAKLDSACALAARSDVYLGVALKRGQPKNLYADSAEFRRRVYEDQGKQNLAIPRMQLSE